MEILVLAVLLVRVGLAMYAVGLTRAKNAAGVVARALCDLGVAVLAFYLLGAALVSQEHNRYFAMSFLVSAMQVILGGALVFASGVLIGSA